MFRGKRGKGYNVPDGRVYEVGVSPIFRVISASVLGVVWWVGADSHLFAVSCPFRLVDNPVSMLFSCF